MSARTRKAATRWAREWAAAWREHDVERIARLYAAGASFRSQPFRELQEPARYAAWAFESEHPGPEIRFGAPAVVEEDRAVVEYWAVVRDGETGGETTIAGAAILRFDANGLVVEQRDYWNDAGGRHESPLTWGR